MECLTSGYNFGILEKLVLESSAESAGTWDADILFQEYYFINTFYFQLMYKT